jgi:hypothetical protein
MRVLATFAIVLVTTMTAAINAGGVSRVNLTVRLYNTARVPVPELMSARNTAESILNNGGLEVIVRHCGAAISPVGAADACGESLTSTEVVVRIIDAPAFDTALHPDAFGVTYVVQTTNRGWLATVFADRIDRAASRARVEPGTLLGRVMAHEIGHLLLGSGYHGPAGVMRAEWPDALLNRGGDDWGFSIDETARMQRTLISIGSRRPT